MRLNKDWLLLDAVGCFASEFSGRYLYIKEAIIEFIFLLSWIKLYTDVIIWLDLGVVRREMVAGR